MHSIHLIYGARDSTNLSNKPFSASQPIKTFPGLRSLVWFTAGAKQAAGHCWLLLLLLHPLIPHHPPGVGSPGLRATLWLTKTQPGFTE